MPSLQEKVEADSDLFWNCRRMKQTMISKPYLSVRCGVQNCGSPSTVPVAFPIRDRKQIIPAPNTAINALTSRRQ